MGVLQGGTVSSAGASLPATEAGAVEGLTFGQLYADLVAACTQELPADYFTLRQFRADTGTSERVALKELGRLVECGKLETMLATIDGRQLRIWWFTEAG